MSILTLNCGSSSVKYSLFDLDRREFTCRGLVERVGTDQSLLQQEHAGRQTRIERACRDHGEAVGLVLEVLTAGPESPIGDKGSIRAVGHRVVHGGEEFATSALVTPEMLGAVERLAELAPLHNPPNLAGIHAATALLPGVPQVAVFDTAFHQGMQPEAYVYPLPYEWYEKHGIRRYGFHGTSHLYVAARAAVMLDRPLEDLKLITLHIGNGASAAAVMNGHSVDTSMGFTPLEGLVMGTRCGWIDPAIVTYVMQREGLDAGQMDRTLNKRSGLLGLSGRFTDRRDILAGAEDGDERCRLALQIECRAIAKIIGSYAAVMGGLDGVVFTAGVGENAAPIRARALGGLEFLGIRLDQHKNEQAVGGEREQIISSAESQVAVMVIPTNEELVIAEDTLAIIEKRHGQPGFSYSFAGRSDRN